MPVSPTPEPGTTGPAPASILERIRVLIVDDHPVVRDGLRSVLEAQPDMPVVGEAADGLGALRQMEALRPDVVLLDIFMPGMGGIEATRAIKGRWPDTRVVLLTALDTPSLVHRALSAGADGYLLKDTLRQSLVNAIRAVAGGHFVLPGRLWQSLLPHLRQED